MEIVIETFVREMGNGKKCFHAAHSKFVGIKKPSD